MSSLRLNTIFAAVGNFSMTIAAAVSLIVIARLGSPELVGRFTCALSVCAPIFILAGLQLRDLKATESSKRLSLRDFFDVSIFTNSIAMLAVGPACWLVGFDNRTVVVAILIGLWRFSTGLCELVYGQHQGNANLKIVSKLQSCHGLSVMLMFSTTFYLTRDLRISLLTVVIADVLLFAFMDFQTIRHELIRPSESDRSERARRLRRLIWSAFPLGMANAIFAVNMAVPRIYLEDYFSLKEVGVFSTLVFFARTGTPIMLALGQAASKQLAEAVQSGNRQQFMRLLKKTAILPLLFGIVATVMSWMLGQLVIEFIYGPAYVTSKTAIVLVAIYATLAYVAGVLAYGVIATRRLKSQLVVLSITAVSVVVSGLWLIPTYGVTGACGCLTISAVIRIIGTVIINLRAVSAMDKPKVLDYC